MASHSGPFTDVSIIVTNEQRGRDRVCKIPWAKETSPNGSSSNEDWESRPRIRDWRCNLTALSQIHNLYFVAYIDLIAVYIPTFPTQSLPSLPVIRFRPPTSRPGLQGYLDRHRPHSITRVHMDFLGTEEILLLACDDGDVIGYKVDQIQDIIERHLGRDFDEPILDVRTFFHKNVSMSAWGLAVHQEARLIAVSSNTHRVVVFAFALAKNNESGSESEPSVSRSESHVIPNHPSTIEDFPSPREQEHVIELVHASDNIPQVSFDNSGADPQGKWLLSSVIDGNVYLWNIPKYHLPPRRMRLGFCPETTPHGGRPSDLGCVICFLHAAWNAVFLDPRSFRAASSVEEAIDSEDVDESHRFWKARPTRNQFNLTEEIFGSSDEESSDEEEPEAESQPDIQLVDFEPIDDSGDLDDADSVDQIENQSAMEGVVMDIEEQGEQSPEGNMPNNGPNPTAPTPPPVAANSPPQAGQNQVFSAVLNLLSPTNELLAQVDAITAQVTNVNDQPFHDPAENSTPGSSTFWDRYPSHRRPEPWIDADVSPSEIIRDAPRCPILITTKNDIFLLQPQKHREAAVIYPVVVLHEPFGIHQVGYNSDWQQLDRLVLLQQIPELGIVIVGSQKGYVAVLSLTHTMAQTKKGSKSAKTYAFRLQCTLPLPQQETGKELEMRPGRALIGLAVSPVQGMLGPPERLGATARRWRLILYYGDHSIVSYEIGKFRREQELGVEPLVV